MRSFAAALGLLLLIAVPRLLAQNPTCSDFQTQEQAQASYNNGNTRLDSDGDGIACEGLPTGGTGGTTTPPVPESTAPGPSELPSTGWGDVLTIVLGAVALAGGGLLLFLTRDRSDNY